MISPEGVIAAEWCLYSLALLLASTRISLHVRMNNHKLLVSDLFLLIAMVDCTGLIICDTITYKAGSLAIFDDTISTYIRQVRFATNYFFDFGLYFPKFSMLAFYFQIIPRTHPALRKAMYAVIAFVTCASLTTLFADTFWCGTNVSINWSDKPDACSVFAAMHLTKMNWSLNFISEALILILPFPLIHGLNLRHKSEKIGLLVVFMLGGVTLTVSTARFIGQLIVSNNIAIYILAMTEYSVAIMIVSLISLRPLLRKIYRVATGSQDNSPFSRSGDKSRTAKSRKSGAPATASRWKGSRVVYSEQPRGRNMYGSEVELTEVEPGKIYKTEEISVTSAQEVEPAEDGKSTGSQEGKPMALVLDKVQTSQVRF